MLTINIFDYIQTFLHTSSRDLIRLTVLTKHNQLAKTILLLHKKDKK